MKKTSPHEGHSGPDKPANDFPANLASPARRALIGAGYTHLAQLTMLNEADLLQLHGMGPKALGQLRDALTEQGLSFAKTGESKCSI